MSIMHENSFIKTYDEYFQKTLIPAYEKLTGVKIKYELVSVGGLQTRVTTVAETGSGPDMTLNFFNWPFLYDEKYVDVGDVAEEVGKKAAAGMTRQRRPSSSTASGRLSRSAMSAS